MTYEDPETRRAYVQGVRDAYETAIPFCRPDRVQELKEWLDKDLASWTRGEPPPAPYLWELDPL